ncbi:MAG: hypothetical protein M5R42_05585 [Rhodocyclaceae bacterium]|nr:hypothetical protein [Rhodocyclaceae bacterium]
MPTFLLEQRGHLPHLTVGHAPTCLMELVNVLGNMLRRPTCFIAISGRGNLIAFASPGQRPVRRRHLSRHLPPTS